MKTSEIIYLSGVVIVATILITASFSNNVWEKEAVDTGVARYHPDTGEFEWTNVKILPQWNKIKQMVEFLDEQRKTAKFNGQMPAVVPQQQTMPQGYQANSY